MALQLDAIHSHQTSNHKVVVMLGLREQKECPEHYQQQSIKRLLILFMTICLVSPLPHGTRVGGEKPIGYYTCPFDKNQGHLSTPMNNGKRSDYCK